MKAKIICVVNDTVFKDKDLRIEHGLAFWIETQHGIVLLDTGETGEVLLHNLSVLSLDPRDIQAVVLSHAHIDHTGGLDALLQLKPDARVFAHPDILRPRYSLRKGKYEFVGLPQGIEALLSGSRVTLTDQPVEVITGIWTTGGITPRPEFEGRSVTHFIRSDGIWLPDPYKDDMSLVIKTEQGLRLVCGCCHAGLLNTLLHIRKNFYGRLISVTGGTHLMAAGKPQLDQVINYFAAEPETEFYLNHCTGREAIQALGRVFAGRVIPFHAGCEMILNC